MANKAHSSPPALRLPRRSFPMNKSYLVALTAAFVAGLSGCSSMSNTEAGASVGGLLGAGTGAAIGSVTGHTGAGALIGHSVDESEKKAELAAAANARGPLGITDVVQMAQSHVTDDVIISQIRSTGSVFHLSANDTIWLKQNGVSDVVVKEMLASAYR